MSELVRLRGRHGRWLSSAVVVAAIAALVAACGSAAGTPALATSRPIGASPSGPVAVATAPAPTAAPAGQTPQPTAPPAGRASPPPAQTPTAESTPAAPSASSPSPPAPAPTPTATASASPATTPATAVLVGAGDIADCSVEDDAVATGRLVRKQPSTAVVVTAGDNAYPDGTLAQFRACYRRAWGAFRSRTHPAAGNHDWVTQGAAGYRAYFGRAVAGGAASRPGRRAPTWYAFDAGAWRVIVLDSDCWAVGGCGPRSPEGRWLAAELASEAAHPGGCQLAIWHHPIASSGIHGDTATSLPLWRAVAAAGVDVVINGHDHHYERFAELDRKGDPVAAGQPGTREFIVGTGGAGLYPVLGRRDGSEAAVIGRHGIIRLDLATDGYAWQFLSTPSGRALDAGSDTCH